MYTYSEVGPVSKESYLALQSVMKEIDFVDLGVRLTYQFSPLPFHLYSFKIHQAFVYFMNHSTAN